MPQRLAGQLLDGGDPVADEPVFVVDTGPADETTWSIVATDRSAADGSWSVTVPSADVERYHAVAQFEESGTFKNALSKPFLTSQPFAQPGLVTVGFDVLSPAVGVGSAIPDSVIHQYLKNDFTTSNWPDSEGTSDIDSISGLSFDTSAFNNDGGVSGDGVDGHGLSDTMGKFGSSMDSNWAISIPFQTTAGEDNAALGLRNAGDDTALYVWLNGVGFSASINNTGLLLADNSGSEIRMDTDDSFADGDPHHLIINKTGLSGADIDFYVDVMTSPTEKTVGAEGSPTDFSDFDSSMAYFARSIEGSLADHADANMGTIRWFSDSLNESERQTVNDSLGWV